VTATLPQKHSRHRVGRSLPVVAAGLAIALVVLGFRVEPRLDFVAAVVATILGGALVSRASGLSLRRLTIPAVWYYSHLSTIIIPALFLASATR
jgi:phosphatidylserine synthase